MQFPCPKPEVFSDIWWYVMVAPNGSAARCMASMIALRQHGLCKLSKEYGVRSTEYEVIFKAQQQGLSEAIGGWTRI